MGTYYFNDRVKFELPWDFTYTKEYNDDGKGTYHIKTGHFVDDNGEERYKFSCVVGEMEKNPEHPITSLQDAFKRITEGKKNARRLFFDGKPEVAMFTYAMPMQIFGLTLQYYCLIAPVLVGQNDIITLTVVSLYKDDAPQDNLYTFEKIAQIISGISVDGKSNNLRSINGHQLHEALKPCFEDREVIDVDEKLYNDYGFDTAAVDESDGALDETSARRSQTYDKLCFEKGTVLSLPCGLELPVPDGYHCCAEGTGMNADWSYIVPESVPLSGNHIDAKPYSFGITCLPVSKIDNFNSGDIETVKQKLLAIGQLAPGVRVDDVIVSDKCAFLYQNWTDTADATYNKIKGFIIAGNDIYLFHCYANHTSAIAYAQETIDAFLAVGKSWMQRVQYGSNGNVASSNTPATSKATSKLVPRSDCKMDDHNVLSKYHGEDTNLILPEGISAIGANAFSSKETIRSVVIPEGVKEIGQSAFWGCRSLEYVKLPNSLEKIHTFAFSECSSLKQIEIPSSVKEVGSYIFFHCSSLEAVSWNASVEVIPAGMFSSLPLIEFRVPEGVTRIEDVAFSSCNKLKDIYFPKSLRFISPDAFNLTSGMTIHGYRGSYAEEYTIGHFGKFQPIDETADQQIPQESAKIEQLHMVIEGTCLKFYFGDEKEVTVPEGITSIAEKVFCEKTMMQTINLPNSLQRIYDEAFWGCSALTEIVIPDSVIEIGKNAFSKCTALEKITIPNSVEYIGSGAFEDCKALQPFSWPAATKTVPRRTFVELPWTEFRFPEGVTEIDVWAFYKCMQLKDIYLPRSISKISDDAFYWTFGARYHGYPGSYVEKYIKERGSTFVPIMDAPKPTIKSEQPAKHEKTEQEKKEEQQKPQRGIPCTVNFGLNGGFGDLRPQTARQGEAIEIPYFCPSRKGFDFLGWDTSERATYGRYNAGASFTVNGNTTLYAVWKKKPNCTITFDLNGGSGYVPAQIKESDKDLYIQTNEPTRAGYKFLGWSRSNLSKMVVYRAGEKYLGSADLTLYAVWEEMPKPARKEGCYIATAVYGSYDAWQVLVLRRFRDEVLQNSAFGRWFIRTYYRFSPPVAEKLKNAKTVNSWVRSILDRFVDRLSHKENNRG